MVHALVEAHRVLKPGGLLVDLRPAPAHRQLGLFEGRRWRLVGPLHEYLDDDYAADAAVARLGRVGYFRPSGRARFQVDRVMDTLDDIRGWLADFDQRRDLPSHAPLLQRLERRLEQPAKISVRGRMKLGVFRKLEEPLIVAILPDASKTESLLNNLSEADFDLSSVSVLMQDVALRDKIAGDTGPLQGVKPAQAAAGLNKAGVSDAAVRKCADAIKQGKAVVAMKVDPKYESAATEMFKDMQAEIVEE